MLSRCFSDFVQGPLGLCHRTESDVFLFLRRHGLFYIQGWGGAWVFCPGRYFFSVKIGARLFFRWPFGPDFFPLSKATYSI